jgi:hypothetical protein
MGGQSIRSRIKSLRHRVPNTRRIKHHLGHLNIGRRHSIFMLRNMRNIHRTRFGRFHRQSIAICIPRGKKKYHQLNDTKAQIKHAPETSTGLISGEGLDICHSSSHKRGAGEQTAATSSTDPKLLLNIFTFSTIVSNEGRTPGSRCQQTRKRSCKPGVLNRVRGITGRMSSRSTMCRTVSSSIGCQGRCPILRISIHEMAYA